jgi:hypothetical protein
MFLQNDGTYLEAHRITTQNNNINKRRLVNKINGKLILRFINNKNAGTFSKKYKHALFIVNAGFVYLK